MMILSRLKQSLLKEYISLYALFFFTLALIYLPTFTTSYAHHDRHFAYHARC